MRFGDMSLADMPAINFYGNWEAPRVENHQEHSIKVLRDFKPPEAESIYQFNPRDIKMSYLYIQVLKKQRGEDALIDLTNEITRRLKVQQVFKRLVEKHGLSDSKMHFVPRNYECLRAMIDTYQKECSPIMDFDLEYI